MCNKRHPNLIFFFYTIGIYLFPVLIGIFCGLCYYGLEGAYHYLELLYGEFYTAFYLLKHILGDIYPMNTENFIVFLFICVLLTSYIIPFVIWYNRQTLLKAFALSFMGLFFGPGIALFVNPSKQVGLLGFFTFIIICLFYSLLYIGGKWQKKNYPDNKLANKIRFILAWPCLRI